MKPTHACRTGSDRILPRVRSSSSWLLLLALPFALLFLNPNWFFSNYGLDPWFYFGYFVNFSDHINGFKDTYYGTRLAWIGPGHLAYKLFPPLLANNIIHLTLYYATVLPFHYVLTKQVSRRTALLLSLGLGTSSMLLNASGWDYVNGACIAYLLLTIAMMAAAESSSRRHVFLILSGVFLQCALNTNLFVINLAPSLVFLFLTRFRLRELAYPAIGLLASCSAFVLIYYQITQDWNFFGPTFAISSSASQHLKYWDPHFATWLRDTPWIWLLALVLVFQLVFQLVLLASEGARLPKLGERSRIFATLFVLNTLIFLAWELHNGIALKIPYYAFYLFPFASLSLATPIDELLKRLKHWQAGILLVSFLLAWLVLVVFRYRLTQPTSLSLALLAVPLIIMMISHYRQPMALAALGILACMNFVVDNPPWHLPMAKERWASVYDGIRKIHDFDPSEQTLIWYDKPKAEPYWRIFNGIAAAYLWDNRLLNLKFPDTTPMGQNWLAPEVPVALLSLDDRVSEQLSGVSKQTGWRPQILKRESVQNGDLKFMITFLKFIR